MLSVVSNQASRNYLPWVLYNPFDFFNFLGLATSLLFIFATFKFDKLNKVLNNVEKKIFILFWPIFLLLVISGASRGEVGRIWIPMMWVPILLANIYATKVLRFSTKQFAIILALLFIQIIIIEEFWVPIW